VPRRRRGHFTHGLQAGLSNVLRRQYEDCLVKDLEAASAGAVGKPTQAALIGDSRDTSRRRQQASARVLAQLRSQRASGAMAWMSVPPAANDRPGAAPMSSMAAATMILVAIFIDGWGIQGEVCPWRCSDVSPTSTHAISCPSQHIRGHNATHTAQKRCLQRILRQHHVSIVRNEDASVFKVPGYRADTVIDPGCLHFSSAYRNKGIVLDTSVRAPTASSYLTGKTNASNTDGYAAGVGEDAKVKHHTGTLTSSWAFVPFVQESYGRLGKQTSLFVKELAMHSALCSGGGKADVLRKAGLAKRQILIELSISLARELAERVMAYTRGARMLGCVAAPVSKLLGHSAD
jgi:hypothetical protein